MVRLGDTASWPQAGQETVISVEPAEDRGAMPEHSTPGCVCPAPKGASAARGRPSVPVVGLGSGPMHGHDADQSLGQLARGHPLLQ